MWKYFELFPHFDHIFCSEISLVTLFWSRFIKMIGILLDSIKSSHTGDWFLHLKDSEGKLV